jgi:hypothetical protein
MCRPCCNPIACRTDYLGHQHILLLDENDRVEEDDFKVRRYSSHEKPLSLRRIIASALESF